jgi:4-amino-4-deoxy-L-arabinose transferase-like glycosyltransferase
VNQSDRNLAAFATIGGVVVLIVAIGASTFFKALGAILAALVVLGIVVFWIWQRSE